jgi:Tfp pilus assembly protein PilZ
MNRIRCPKLLYLLSIIMVAFPVSYLLFSAFIFELNSRGILSLILSPLFYISSFLWVMTGVGLQRMRQWSWYTFGGAQFFTVYLNALNLVQNSNSDYKGLAFVVSILIQIYTFILVSRGIRVPFLFPKIRWWESGTAGMNQIPVELLHMSSVTGTSHAQLLDMHPRGCFIKTPADFEPFEKIQIRMEAFGHKVDVSGYVVWNAKSTVTHPRGIGVQFVDLDRQKRRKVKVIAQRFEKQREGKDVRPQLSQKSA